VSLFPWFYDFVSIVQTKIFKICTGYAVFLKNLIGLPDLSGIGFLWEGGSREIII